VRRPPPLRDHLAVPHDYDAVERVDRPIRRLDEREDGRGRDALRLRAAARQVGPEAGGGTNGEQDQDHDGLHSGASGGLAVTVPDRSGRNERFRADESGRASGRMADVDERTAERRPVIRRRTWKLGRSGAGRGLTWYTALPWGGVARR